jgi:hypothetical protein
MAIMTNKEIITTTFALKEIGISEVCTTITPKGAVMIYQVHLKDVNAHCMGNHPIMQWLYQTGKIKQNPDCNPSVWYNIEMTPEEFRTAHHITVTDPYYKKN